MRVQRSIQIRLASVCACVFVLALAALAFEPVGKWSAGTEKIAAIAGGNKSAEDVETAPDTEKRAGTRCLHCAIVESIQRITAAGDGAPVYQVTVRLSDQTKRVFHESSAPRWRPGERIVLIEGGPSARN